MTTATNLDVANTIINQLGGRRFAVMTGAKNFAGYANGVNFKVPSSMTKKRISHVKIVLTPADLYDVEFLHIRGTNAPQSISKHEGVYAEDLVSLFETETGLYTKF